MKTRFAAPNTSSISVPARARMAGDLVAEGTIKEIVRCEESLTGKLLREPLRHPLHKSPRNRRQGRGNHRRHSPQLEERPRENPVATAWSVCRA